MLTKTLRRRVAAKLRAQGLRGYARLLTDAADRTRLEWLLTADSEQIGAYIRLVELAGSWAAAADAMCRSLAEALRPLLEWIQSLGRRT